VAAVSLPLDVEGNNYDAQEVHHRLQSQSTSDLTSVGIAIHDQTQRGRKLLSLWLQRAHRIWRTEVEKISGFFLFRRRVWVSVTATHRCHTMESVCYKKNIPRRSVFVWVKKERENDETIHINSTIEGLLPVSSRRIRSFIHSFIFIYRYQTIFNHNRQQGHRSDCFFSPFFRRNHPSCPPPIRQPRLLLLLPLLR